LDVSIADWRLVVGCVKRVPSQRFSRQSKRR
jgi:hypothetical protein